MRRVAIIFLAVLSGSLAKGQSSRELPDAIRQIIETIAANSEEENIDIQALYDTYESLLENPINLNAATEADLRSLQILTDFQIQSLLDYRKEYGILYTLHELPLIHGFSEEIAAQLSPFITVATINENIATFKDRLTRGRHQVIVRTATVLEQQVGYSPITPEELAAKPNARYLGGPWSLYTRYKYNYKNKMQWGITADNDAGEPFFTGPNKYGFDFYSAHIQVADVGIVKQAIVGDYQVQFGQGLVAWGGYSLGKTGDVLSIKKQERGLTPYSSTDENNFRRGAAVTLQHKQWSLSVFASHKNIDATIDSLSFSSMQATGQHNTVSTMTQKHALSETVAGGNMSYRFKFLKIGTTALWHRYGKNYERAIKPYNQFELAASQNTNVGIDFYSVWRKTSFFGEVAASANGGWAGLVGALFDLDRALRLSLLYRNYGRNYQAMYAQGFGETSKTANEEGFYVGAQWIPHAELTVSAYADVYAFPWMRYRVYAPSHGFEYWVQADYRPKDNLSMYIRIKQEIKEENISGGNSAIQQLQEVSGWHARYEISYELFPGLKMRDHIELSFYKAAVKENGLLLYHDVKYKLPTFPLDFSVRFAVFDTDSWNTRFYAYEDDILYAFSVPAYANKGARWYFNLHVRPVKRIDFWLRIAQSYYFNTLTVSSGLAQINAPHQTTLKLQMSVKL